MAEEMQATSGMDVEMRDADVSSSDSDSDESEHIETLVEGRSKRATAGNRLTNLIEKEADDDLELLFEEAEDDIEFEGAEGDDSDIQLESSSDEDDQGPEARGDDEYEGETELQKHDRAERLAKKRKAQDRFKMLGTSRKKVKIDPTTALRPPTTPAARPKKKSERVSWLPTPDEGPVRQSSRRQTVQNKELTHAKLKEDMERREKTIAQMEKAAKRKERLKPKQMTQAERLAEAAKTERQNKKSLNRWEEMEKKREEEQKAKLAALHNRKLDGPVVTFWSGAAKWVGDKLTHVGMRPVKQETDKEGRGRKKKDKDSIVVDQPKTAGDNVDESANTVKESIRVPAATESSNIQQTPLSNAQQITFVPPQGPGNFLDGIQHYAAMSTDAQPVAEPNLNLPAPITPLYAPSQIHEDSTASVQAVIPEVQSSTRNLVVLANFDSRIAQEKGEYGMLLAKPSRLPKKAIGPQKPPQEYCVITSYPARYRDPETGLPYFDKYGYSQIQKLKAGHCSWSNMLGCYVGEAGIAARGVPDKFFAPFGAPPGNGPIY